MRRPCSKKLFKVNELCFTWEKAFSYAHRKIKIRGIDYIVQPKITLGAKAFHFSITREYLFKQLQRLIFIAGWFYYFYFFGEKDCRQNEDLFLQPQSITNHRGFVSFTAKEFVELFSTQLQNFDHNSFLMSQLPYIKRNIALD